MARNKLVMPNDNYTEAELDKLRALDYPDGYEDMRLEHYGAFLHEDDFEIRMSAVFNGKPGSTEELELKLRICESEIRTLWLKKGAARFGSWSWWNTHTDYVSAHMRWRLLKALYEKQTTGKYTMQEPLAL